jgi:hypothetical protein
MTTDTLLSTPASSNTTAGQTAASTAQSGQSNTANANAGTNAAAATTGQTKAPDAPPATTTANANASTGDSLLDKTDPNAKPGDGQKQDAPPVVPEKYDIKVPDGITLDEKLVSEFTNVAKELKLTNEQAQKLVDLQTKGALDHAQKITSDYNSTVESWKKETLEKLGPKHGEEIGYANKFLDKFANSETRQLLIDTGLANNYNIMNTLIKAGKAIAEDRLTDGHGSANGSKKSAAEILYGGKA